MSAILRVILMLSAMITVVWILRKIYRCKVKLKDAIFWFCMAALLAVFGIVPQVAYWCASIMGFQAAANFIFLVILALAMEKLFTLSIIVSQLEDKVTVLSAEVALRAHDERRKIEQLEKEIGNYEK